MEAYDLLVYLLAYIGLFATSFYIINVFRYYRKENVQPRDDKTVSIIIPAYNEEEGIARTIESALALDYPKEKLEIIIIDDGSVDKTYETAKRFESKSLPRVRVFTKPNGGKGTALNLGISKSKNEIIVSMDADSFARPDALKRMIGYFYNDNVMSVTPSMGIHEPRGILQRIQQVEYDMGFFLRKSFATVNAIHVTPGAFSAYRKSFFVKYGGYDEKNITEDLEIALRIQANNFIIENAPKAIVYTVTPNKFKQLMYQRRRWYAGLIKNLWEYRRLFGPRYGALGTVVLPIGVITVVLSVALTIYLTINTISKIHDNLNYLRAINFQFKNIIEINSFVFKNFLYSLFSQKLFLITAIFILVLSFYLYFSKKHYVTSKGVKLSLALFLAFYSFLFAFWWIISAFYVLFNKRVFWRLEKK